MMIIKVTQNKEIIAQNIYEKQNKAIMKILMNKLHR